MNSKNAKIHLETKKNIFLACRGSFGFLILDE
jgi:hypothetical protein